MPGRGGRLHVCSPVGTGRGASGKGEQAGAPSGARRGGFLWGDGYL